MTAYPGAVASFSTKFDLTDVVFAVHINALQDEVAAIQSIVGTVPQGSASTVKQRLVDIETALAQVTGRFSGGSGTLPTSSVAASAGTGFQNLDAEQAYFVARIDTLTQDVAILINGVTQEVNDRTAADNALQANLTNAINAEVSRAMGREDGIDNDLQAFKASKATMTANTYLGAAQNIPYNTWTTVAFDSNDTSQASSQHNPYSYRGNFQVGGRFYTLGDAGTYELDLRACFEANNTGLRGVRWVTAGGTVVGEYITEATLTNVDFLAVTASFSHDYQSGYYVQAQVFHTATVGGSPHAIRLFASTPANPVQATALFVPL